MVPQLGRRPSRHHGIFIPADGVGGGVGPAVGGMARRSRFLPARFLSSSHEKFLQGGSRFSRGSRFSLFLTAAPGPAPAPESAPSAAVAPSAVVAAAAAAAAAPAVVAVAGVLMAGSMAAGCPLGVSARLQERLAKLTDRLTPKGPLLAVRCDQDEVFSFFPCIAMEADAEWDLEDGDAFAVKWLDTVDYDPQTAASAYYPG